MLTESQVFEDEVLPGTERADHPAEEMPKRHDHGKNLYRNSPNRAFRQVIHFAGVRRFGETQAKHDPEVQGDRKALDRRLRELAILAIAAMKK